MSGVINSQPPLQASAPTTTQPSASASASPSSQSGNTITNIPTSTVSAIGGGFIGFAFTVLLSLTLLRVFRVYRDVKRRQRQGENIRFSQQWNTEGGFWGFLTGIGGGGSNILVGAGGRRDLDLWRIWDEYGIGGLGKNGEDAIPPEMWEVEVPIKEKSGMDSVEWESIEPISVRGASVKKPDQGDISSKLDIAVLVLMPTSPDRTTFKVDDEDYDDLPDVVVGTVELWPTIRSVPDTIPATTAVSSMDELKTNVEEVQLEDVREASRPARWQKHDGRWGVEGLL